MNGIICGVDVSKDWLDVHVRPAGVTGRFGNDAAGIAELAAWCGRHGVELVAMEASGDYERLAYLLLSDLGQPCAAPLNARNVRRFAEAMGFLEKPDRTAAGVIAHYADVREVRPPSPPSPAQQRHPSGEIASLIDDDPLRARLDAALRSVKGVAKGIGLAPIANDSGGRSDSRSIPFLIACLAARYDPHLKAFHDRLQTAGKPKMVIRIALARKLLVILNAKARDARNEFANAT